MGVEVAITDRFRRSREGDEGVVVRPGRGQLRARREVPENGAEGIVEGRLAAFLTDRVTILRTLARERSVGPEVADDGDVRRLVRRFENGNHDAPGRGDDDEPEDD